jgi:hypothetical protein
VHRLLKTLSLFCILLATAGFAYTWYLTNHVADISSAVRIATAKLWTGRRPEGDVSNPRKLLTSPAGRRPVNDIAMGG